MSTNGAPFLSRILTVVFCTFGVVDPAADPAGGSAAEETRDAGVADLLGASDRLGVDWTALDAAVRGRGESDFVRRFGGIEAFVQRDDRGEVLAQHDLGEVFVYSTVDTAGDLVIYIGVERPGTAGDSTLEIELNQNPVRAISGASSTIRGLRTVDDLLLRLSLVHGVVAEVEVKRWTAEESFELLATAGGLATSACNGEPRQLLVCAGPSPAREATGTEDAPRLGWLEIGVNAGYLVGVDEFASLQIRTPGDVVTGKFRKARIQEPDKGIAPQRAACTGDAFIVQDVVSQLTRVDSSTSPFSFVDIGLPAGLEYNAMGFRSTDGLLYAVQLSPSGNTQILQIDRGGLAFGLGRPPGLPATPRFDGGDVSTDGSTMYIATSNLPLLHLLDLTSVPRLPAVTTVRITGADGYVFDWAYNPSDGLLYGGDSSDGQLAVLDPATGVRSDFDVAAPGILPAGTAYGGSWFDAGGRLFLYRNTGEIYEIDLDGPTVIDVAAGPGSLRNDGAGCTQNAIGAAKQMTATTDGLPETIIIDFVFESFLAGDGLFGLSSTDDLTPVFGVHGVDWAFTSIASVPAGFANPAYDGHQNVELVNQAPGQSLAPGATAEVTVVIEILSEPETEVFCNQVLVVAETSAGTLVGDVSTAGLGPDPNGDGSPDESELACASIAPVPDLALSKSLQSNADDDGSGDPSVGDTLTYRMVADNVGTANLTGVTVSDPLMGLSPLSCTPAQPAALSPGAVMSCTATYEVTAADVTAGQIANTATASSDQTPNVTDSVTISVPTPALDLVKGLLANSDEDGSGDVSLGDTVIYSFAAINVGTANLTGVTISDPLMGLSSLSCTPAQPAVLSPGTTMSCTAAYEVTAADAAEEELINTATASSDQTPDAVASHSQSISGGPVPLACDGEAYFVREIEAQLAQVDRSTSPFTLVDIGPTASLEYNNMGFRRSDGLLYAVQLTSNGNSQILRIDSKGRVLGLGRPPGLPAGPRFDAGDVSSDGGTMYITTVNQPLYRLDLTSLPALPAVTSVTPSGSTGHVFDWAASPVDGLLYGGDSSDGQLAILDPVSGSRIDRNLVDSGLGTLSVGIAFGGAWFNAAGQLFLYRNDGVVFEVDPAVPTIVDVRAGAGSTRNDGAACAQGVLGAAQRMTATEDGLPETITIEWVIENPSADEELFGLSAEDDLTAVFGVHGVDWTFTSISSVPAAFANPGFDGHGDVELVNQAPAQSLSAGAQATVTVVVEVLTFAALDAGRFCDQVQVRGEDAAGTLFGDLTTEGLDVDPNGDGSPDERRRTCVSFSSVPALGLAKTLQSNADEDGSGDVSQGDTLTYGFVATNVGIPDLTSVAISDPLSGLSPMSCIPGQPADLPSGSSVSCTATYVVTAADVAAGQIVNTATASSDQTSDEVDSVTVPVPVPALELAKGLQSNSDEDGSGDVTEGDTLTYDFVATNVGTANLDDVTIDDPLSGLSSLSCLPAQPAALSPGSSVSCTATYVVTAADAVDGQIVNTATASSGQTADVQDGHTEPVAGGPVPFPCDGEAYLVRNADAQLSRIDRSTAPFTFVDLGPAAGIEYNNLGFRRTDGFLYAVELIPGGNVQILQIDATGSVTGLGRPAGLPAGPRFDAGDISSDGGTMYITATNQPLYRLDLTSLPSLPAVTSVTVSGSTGFVFDWAASPIDALLYGGDSSGGQLAILDPATGVRTDFNLVDTGLGTLPTGTAFGGAWFDASGRLFLYRNSGEIYQVDLSVPTIVDIENGPGATRNDAAACATAVP